MNQRKIKIFAGVAGTPLAQEVCKRLSIELGQAAVGRHPDGEVKVRLTEDVRGTDVFIINPTNPPDSNLMDTILLADACEGSSAGRITLVIPYLGYNRQDRKDKPRVAVSAAVVIGILARSGCHRVLLFDLHSEPTAGIFRQHHITVDHLYASVVSLDYLKPSTGSNSVIATPDAGGTARAKSYARRLGKPLVICNKERHDSGSLDDGEWIVIGDVKAKDVTFVDDILDTAGTAVGAAKAVIKQGARSVRYFASHGLFSGQALQILEESPIEEVIVTDSIQQPADLETKRIKITVLPIAPLLALAINKINREESLSDLFL